MAAGLLLALFGVWLVTQTLLASPGLLEVLGVAD